MNTETRNIILADILQCGYIDLVVLDDVSEDLIEEALDEIRDTGLEVSLNGIMSNVFDICLDHLKDSIAELIEELEGEDESEDVLEELEALRALDVYEDINSCCNCLDTSIFFTNTTENENIYRKYLSEELREIEDMTGYAVR